MIKILLFIALYIYLEVSLFSVFSDYLSSFIPASQASSFVLLEVLTSGLLGWYLLKTTGLASLGKFKEAVENSQSPANFLIHQLLILLGSIFLLIPGLFSDAVGLILCSPLTRNLFVGQAHALSKNANFLNIIINKKTDNERASTQFFYRSSEPLRQTASEEEIIDIEAEDLSEKQKLNQK